MIDLKGQRFGRLTVIERSGTYRHYTDYWEEGAMSTQAIWRCVCDCGEETEVLGNNLRAGRTKSCGCLRRERRKKC